MNTNALKKFAQEARRKLIQQVTSKLDFVTTADTPELREKSEMVKALKDELKKTDREQLIEKVAYTWFNRFMALRFMDVNDYQPIGVRVISPISGQTTAELLTQAKQGHIPSELGVDEKKVYNLLDGRITSSNPENEAYKELLIGACNHLHKILPFLFEKIDDYTELLLPDDLTSEFSIIHEVVEGMPEGECEKVEIIGWLYQFYISEKKDEVFASKKKVKKEDIPAATQLFTPRWIVEYMVQNTLGKLWLQNKPNSKLREHMPYFIESETLKSDDYLKLDSPEEIKFLDQAAGSGHILVYAFELLTKIYEEEGYNQSEIANHIITKNLFGFEIDERAAQLAGMALLMKARDYQRRLFRKEVPEPQIMQFRDLKLESEEIKEVARKVGFKLSDELLHDLTDMQQATNYGSLIAPHADKNEIQKAFEKTSQTNPKGDVFLQLQLDELKEALYQLKLLADKYHSVVDNPPYMGGGNMNKSLSDYVKTNYPDSKSDLMASFMEAGINAIHKKGFLGMINQHSWMFLSSYEKLREKLIKNIGFDSLLHLGPRTFPEIGGEVVQSTAFTFVNTKLDRNGVYLRLVDFNKTEVKRIKTQEALLNPNCGWFHSANLGDFKKIPGSPIAYWLSDSFIKIFEEATPLGNLAKPRQGMATSNNNRFIKLWHEVSYKNIGLSKENASQAKESQCMWFPYNKGGGRRKWYGNQEYVVNWKNDGEELMNHAKSLYGSPTRTIKNIDFYFLPSITWSFISSGGFSVRYTPKGFLFDVGGSSTFPEVHQMESLIGLLCSKITTESLKVVAPTINFQAGDIKKIPVINEIFLNKEIKDLVKENIVDSKEEWDSRETSWGFKKNELLKHRSETIEESFDLYRQYWRNKFFKLHNYEKELNKHFIEIYGLQEELNPDIHLNEVTILKDETSVQSEQLVFHSDEFIKQFISYSTGCMFGRYSLDKEGLILANQGDALDDYLAIINKQKQELNFLPDDDNIIPVLDDEWFEDDIVGRFYSFLKASFGEKYFQNNLAFIEEQIGNIRKYFVKSFYKDHIKRYKKRPIYWMFSSPKGYFNVLIYMHRYTPDTLNNILNKYLREFIEKLKNRKEHFEELKISGSASEQAKAAKEIDKLDKMILDCQEYERDILLDLASKRIEIDLDDGVLVNYNKFGKAIKEEKGLNDKKAKEKVRKFDWINTDEII